MKTFVFRSKIQSWMLKTPAVIVEKPEPNLPNYQILRRNIEPGDLTNEITILEDKESAPTWCEENS